MNRYRCTCVDEDTDELCGTCIERDTQDEAEAKEEARQAAREFWAEQEADYAYDPLSRGGFE